MTEPDLVSDADWAKFRREATQALPPELEGKSIPDILLDYQKELLAATAAYQLVATDKSRRVGATWGVGADAVLTAGAQREAGGMDVLYLGYNLDMAREFIDVCAMWARAFLPVSSEVKEFLFVEQDEKGADRYIQAFRINFASGFEIVALSSKPRSLRGRQGYVILDEFAFHDDAAELLKAAIALLIWGGKILVISTHNGFDNPFNELLNEIRAEKRPGKVVRVTFDDALVAGLYKRVCLRSGKEWSPEGEAEWRAGIYKSYGSDADEELRCIPSQSAGAYLSRALILSRMKAEIPVIRWRPPTGFVDWPEELRKAEVDSFCAEQLKPLLDRADPRLRSVFGQDFGRKADLSVIHPAQIQQDVSLSTLFLLELRDVPFESQKRILFYIVDRLPRFSHGSLDATGNGAYLAEVARQKYGVSMISEINISTSFYLLNMPKLRSAFEDADIDLPLDDDVLADYRAIKVHRGIAKVPDDARTEGADGHERHGDAAIAGVLVVHASTQDSGPASADTLGERQRSPDLQAFVAGADSRNLLERLGAEEASPPPVIVDLTDFMRM